MTSQAVAARIAELDALSRARVLDDFESSQLQKLITAQNRYAYSKAQQDAKRAARTAGAVA